MAQNKTHAVMTQRGEPSDSFDDFPSHPWAGRALIEHVLCPAGLAFPDMSVLEPCCGRGHMVRGLRGYFETIYASDILDYGFAPVRDFLATPWQPKSVDWVITNPPFKDAEDFFARAKPIARKGVAFLERSVFSEGGNRYYQMFSEPHVPYAVAQFSERVPMLRGRLEEDASSATAYAWFIWLTDLEIHPGDTRMIWIPPVCAKTLKRPGDYD